jgi:opacity protein-like surface antigen
MNKKLCLVGLAVLLAAPMAFAGDMPAGAIAGYLTSSEIDVEGVGKDDGTGFGIRGWASVSGPWFVHGEYQTTSLDGFDLESLRLGGGFAGEMGSGSMWLAKAELVDFGSDADEDGIGVHVGAMLQASPQFGVFGTLGYLSLNDTDGLELNVGANMAFTREFAGVLDYRFYMGEYDVFGATGDFEITDLRLGVQYMFY